MVNRNFTVQNRLRAKIFSKETYIENSQDYLKFHMKVVKIPFQKSKLIFWGFVCSFWKIEK